MLCYQPPLVRTPARGVSFMGWWFIRFRSSLPFRVFCRTAYASKGLAAILCVDLSRNSSVAHPFGPVCACVVLHPNHDAPEASAIYIQERAAGPLSDRVIEPLRHVVVTNRKPDPLTRRGCISVADHIGMKLWSSTGAQHTLGELPDLDGITVLRDFGWHAVRPTSTRKAHIVTAHGASPQLQGRFNRPRRDAAYKLGLRCTTLCRSRETACQTEQDGAVDGVGVSRRCKAEGRCYTCGSTELLPVSWTAS